MASTPYNLPGSAEDRITIVCLYCNKPQEVGRKAMSITCRFCHKSLRLDDQVIKDYHARRTLDTCGAVTVEKRGHVVVEKIHVGRMIIRGKVKGNILSRGPILLSPDAEIVGNVEAPTIVVAAGAILSGHYRIGENRGEEKQDPVP